MAIDIGTGVMDVQLDRRALQNEARRAERFLAAQRTQLNPMIDRRRLAQRLRQALQRAGGRQTWRPVEREGVRAMERVGASGVSAMRLIEGAGLTTASRLAAAFSAIAIPTLTATATATAAAQQGARRAIVPSPAQIPPPGPGQIRQAARAGAGAALENVGALGQIAAAALAGGPIAALIAGAAVGASALRGRYDRLASSAGVIPGARVNAFLETIGFRQTGRRRFSEQMEVDRDAFRGLFRGSETAEMSLAQLARAANASADQIARAIRQDFFDERGTEDLAHLSSRERELLEGVVDLRTEEVRQISEGVALQEFRNASLRSVRQGGDPLFRQAVIDQATATRRGAILQNRLTDSLEVNRRLIFGTGAQGGLTVFERLRVAGEFIVNRLQAYGIALAALAVATYALVRASIRAEQQTAAQVAAQSIGQARVPGGDISGITAGIRAGADQGLSDLEVYRTAIDAIRTGSTRIFQNTERVLGDLRVVAAATGVAFEDATQRFFRGIIKREQELLDELGIVARVEAANARYAQTLGVAASQLTPYQQQLAFAAEVERQLTVSAQDFGKEGVLATQRVTIATDRLSASFSNLVAEIGEAGRPLALFVVNRLENLVNAVRAITAPFRAISRGILGGTPEVQRAAEINRLETQRNIEIEGRISLLSRAAQAGTLDVQNQRRLLNLQRDLLIQQREIEAAPTGQISARNIDRAEASRIQAENVVRELDEGRSRARIMAIQAPLAELYSSLEGGGRVARLTEEAYQDLTRVTEESEAAVTLFAASVGRTPEQIYQLIEANRGLADSANTAATAVAASVKTIEELANLRIEEPQARLRRVNRLPADAQEVFDSLQFLNREINPEWGRFFGNFRGPQAQAVLDGLSAINREFRETAGIFDREIDIFDVPSADFRAEDRVNLQLREEGRFPGLDISLTATERFAEAAANMGVTLDLMQDNLSSFVEGIALEGQNLRDALTNFLQSIARTIIRASIDQTVGETFGGLFTNAVTQGGIGAAGATRYGSTYTTQVNIGIANPLQSRAAAASARVLEGIGP